MVSRPYRSAMWCGFHGVRWRRSATYGPPSSTTYRIRPAAMICPSVSGANAVINQPICAIVIAMM
ncbi:Uncharacterised protein (plasmid) [Tsukamurella tyrosinosolvens]|nr:Uncharacterised protein [Tsukamurella tyrosinosolvens]